MHGPVVPMRLADGALLRFEVDAPAAADDPFNSEVGFFDRVRSPEDAPEISVLTGPLAAFATEIVARLARSRPDRLTVEFGCDVAIESGRAVAVIAKGSIQSAIKVTLQWDRAPQAGEDD